MIYIFKELKIIYTYHIRLTTKCSKSIDQSWDNSSTQSYTNFTRESENVLMNKVNGKSILLSVGLISEVFDLSLEFHYS